MMRVLVWVVFFGSLGLAVPASAQTIDLPVGTFAATTTPLKLHANAPNWWSWTLPKETGVLGRNQRVTVLKQKSHNTLFGQEVWYKVEEFDDEQDPPMTGWVLGGDGGLSFLTPQLN